MNEQRSSQAQIDESAPHPVTTRLADEYAAVELRTQELLASARILPTTVRSEDDLEAFAVVVRAMRDHGSRCEAIRVDEKEPFLRGGQAVNGFFHGMRERLNKAMNILSLRVKDYQDTKLEAERQAREAEAKRLREEAARLEAQAKRARDEERAAALAIEAKLAAQRAAVATVKVDAAPADMVRTRFSKSGAMTTMARDPLVEITDYDALPLEKLRPYIQRPALLVAVKAWARATEFKETLPGATIAMGTKSVIR